MGIQEVVKLLGGIALFLYGMDVMGSSLEKLAGSRLKAILGNMTSNVFKGFLLGFVVTAAIQSSAATIVMVVGFVNSGLMTLTQATGVIMGANLGTSVTGWIISASGIKGGDSLYYFLAFVGVLLFCFSKVQRRKYVGAIIMGFAILMIGMQTMSASVADVKNSSQFGTLIKWLSNPLLGVCVGTVFTALIQSSSASVGVLQSFSSSVTFQMCVPFVMGANIGTCITALISSFGANKDAKRTSIIHLLFNVLSTLILLPIFYIVTALFPIPMFQKTTDPFIIAVVNTGVKVASLIILMPCSKLLVNLSCRLVREKSDDTQVQLLDERLLHTPAVAIERARTVAAEMAQTSVDALRRSIAILFDYNTKDADEINRMEEMVDHYEDKLGSYLVQLSSHDLLETESREVNKLLHIIGDFERISDHAINIVDSAAEIHEKRLNFSTACRKELSVFLSALNEIVGLALDSFTQDNLQIALNVEPLEQVVDYLQDYLKSHHINRLQKQECTIEGGFVLSDILTNVERVSDHCSNIACCLIELAHNSMDVHEYLRGIKKGDGKESESFNERYEVYKHKYSIPAVS